MVSHLACIAIQSDQNDQHGGQSVPNFDFSMAPGVRKSYKKLYWTNLGKMLECMYDVEDGIEQAKKIGAYIEEKESIYPCMAWDHNYKELELSHLEKFASPEEAKKLQEMATKFADKEIRRKTYQAMEALIHNLNTMHSRAGAQVPFSSLNYGTDTSPSPTPGGSSSSSCPPSNCSDRTFRWLYHYVQDIRFSRCVCSPSVLQMQLSLHERRLLPWLSILFRLPLQSLRFAWQSEPSAWQPVLLP